jgi:hypothetical protein
MHPAPGQAWVPWAWIALGLGGVLMQIYVTAGHSGRVVKKQKK